MCAGFDDRWEILIDGEAQAAAIPGMAEAPRNVQVFEVENSPLWRTEPRQRHVINRPWKDAQTISPQQIRGRKRAADDDDALTRSTARVREIDDGRVSSEPHGPTIREEKGAKETKKAFSFFCASLRLA
jgi:hypothetical protein